MKIIKTSVLIIVSLLLITTCREYLNPVDPDADNYQGFPVYEDDEIPEDASIKIEDIVPVLDSVITDTTPLFDWADITNAEGYELQIALSEELLDEAEILTSDTSSLQIPVEALFTLGESYYWRVRITGEGGNHSAWSQTCRFTVEWNINWTGISPSAGGSTIDSTPLFMWNPVTGANSYNLKYATNQDDLKSATAVSISESNYQYPDVLAIDNQIWWQIQAVNTDGAVSAWTSEMNFTYNWDITWTGMDPADTGTTTDSTPLINWDNIDGAESYTIKLASTKVGLETTDSIDIDTSQYPCTEVLALNGTVWWQVAAENSDGAVSGFSPEYSFSYYWDIDWNGRSPGNGGTTIDTTPLMEWDNANEADSYQIKYASSNEDLESAPPAPAPTSQYQYPSTLALDADVWWEIRGINSDGAYSEWSLPYSFTVEWNVTWSVLEPANEGTTVETTPILNWENITGADTYEVKCATTKIGLDSATAESVDVSQYQYPASLNAGDTIWWRVTAVNEDGVYSADSADYSFTVILEHDSMILVNGGSFTMGDTWDLGADDEKPTHDVSITDFYIGKYEVSFQLWDEVHDWAIANSYTFANAGQAGNSGTPDDTVNEPVTMINWRDVIVWCNAASEKEGLVPVYTYNSSVLKDATSADCDQAVCDWDKLGYRLPTETEWEYAAKGGDSDTNSGEYAGSDTVDDVAWYNGNSSDDSKTIGTKQANELEINDMSGNVWEWCWDWYRSDYYDNSPLQDPRGAFTGSYKTRKGGNWYSTDFYSRVSCRSINRTSTFSNNSTGFRIAQSVDHPADTTRGLVAEYLFDGDATDSSGNGNDGTVNGPTLTADRFSDTESTYDFDGTDDYIDFGMEIFKPQQYTFSLWFMADVIPLEADSSYILTKDAAADYHDLAINVYNTDTLRIILDDGTDFTLSETTISSSTWNHLILSYSGSVVKLYLNNELKDSINKDGLAILSDGNNWIAGAQKNTPEDFFNGQIDDMRIYNRAITEEEIQLLYEEGGWPQAQTPPTDDPLVRHASNPVFPNTTSGWDVNITNPSVLYNNGIYHMWYSANPGSGSMQIGHATSTDGIAWSKDSNNPVVTLGISGAWDDNSVNIPEVIFRNNEYHMWYGGNDGSNYRIGYATSIDGSAWTKYAGNPVINVGTAGSFDDTKAFPGDIIFKDDLFHFWYAGGTGTNGNTNTIGYATSPDGINWTKYNGNPVVDLGETGSWEENSVSIPDITYVNNNYYMWYSGSPTSDTYRIGFATSTDGLTWNKSENNPVLDLGTSGTFDDTYILAPDSIYLNGTYHIWYTAYGSSGYEIGYATLSP